MTLRRPADAESAGDRADLDALVRDFFNAFSNLRGAADVERVYDLCLPQAVIIKAVGDTPEIYTLSEFVEPRLRLLSSGALTNFSERETDHDTFVFGHIAERRSSYSKSGMSNGQAFAMNGAKVFQFVKTPAGWKISAVAWDDEVP